METTENTEELTMIIHTIETVVADPEGVYEDLKAKQTTLREPLRILLETELTNAKVEFNPTLLAHAPLSIELTKNETKLTFDYVEKKRSKDKDRYYLPKLDLEKSDETLELVTKFYGSKLLLDRFLATLMRDYQEFWSKACEAHKSEAGTERPLTIADFKGFVTSHSAKVVDEETALMKSIKKGGLSKAEKRAAKMKLLALLDLDEDDDDDEKTTLDDLENTGF